MKPKGEIPHIRYLFDRHTHLQYRRAMKTLHNAFTFDASDAAKFRLQVLEYYFKWGLQPTIDAYRISKSALYEWRERYLASKHRLVSLVPYSTKPRTVRRMETDWRLLAFIKAMRLEYGNVGARILYPFVAEYALGLSLKPLGRTTIEKVIRRYHFTFEKPHRTRNKTRHVKLRVRKTPKVRKPGYIQVDSITVYVNDEKLYFVSVIDILTKLALVKRVSSLSSANAQKVFQAFQETCPYRIRVVQTDNGSEFLKSFHLYLTEQSIKHVFIYPHSPKTNSVVERFNRTVQEECINRCDELYYDLTTFESKLQRYLVWYNFKRPHSALHYQPPMHYIRTKIPESV